MLRLWVLAVGVVDSSSSLLGDNVPAPGLHGPSFSPLSLKGDGKVQPPTLALPSTPWTAQEDWGTVGTFEPPQEIVKHGVWSVALSPDGSTLLGSTEDCQLYVFDIRGPDASKWRKPEKLSPREFFTECPQIAVGWASNGQRAFVGGWTDKANIWRISGQSGGWSHMGALISEFHDEKKHEAIQSVIWSEDGNKIITFCNEWKAYMWEELLPDQPEQWKIKYSFDHAKKGNTEEEFGDWAPAWLGRSDKPILTGGFGNIDPQGYLWDISGDSFTIHHTIHTAKSQDGTDKTEEWLENFGGLCAVAWSPEGTFIAMGFSKGAVLVMKYLRDNGKHTTSMSKHAKPATPHNMAAVKSIAFSPDKRFILSGDRDDTVAFLEHFPEQDQQDVEDLQTKWAMKDLGGKMVTFTSNGREFLTVGSKNQKFKVTLRAAKVDKDAGELNLDDGTLHPVSWSSDGSWVLAGTSQCSAKATFVCGPDHTNWKFTKPVIERHAERSCDRFAVAWSPRGDKLFAGSTTTECNVWPLMSGSGEDQGLIAGRPEKLLAEKDNDEKIASVVWSRSGDEILTIDELGKSVVWNQNEHKQFHVKESYSLEWDAEWNDESKRPSWWASAWSPKGDEVVSGGGHHTAVIWFLGKVETTPTGLEQEAPATEKPQPKIISRLKHDDTVLAVAWSEDSKMILTGCADATARIWKRSTSGEGAESEWTTVAKLTGHKGKVQAVAWCPDGRQLITGSDDKTAIVWTKGDSDETWSASETVTKEIAVSTVACSGSGREVLIGSDKSAHIVRIWTGTPQHIVHVKPTPGGGSGGGSEGGSEGAGNGGGGDDDTEGKESSGGMGPLTMMLIAVALAGVVAFAVLKLRGERPAPGANDGQEVEMQRNVDHRDDDVGL